MTETIYLLVGVALAFVVAWCYFTAQRLNHLHIRMDRARYSLESALNRRAAVLAALHPAVADAARAAEEIELSYENFDARREAEQALLDAVGFPGDGEMVAAVSEPARLQVTPSNQGDVQARTDESDAGTAALADASVRVPLAARFYNQAVSDVRHLRRRPLVTFFRLAGNAPQPSYY